MRVSTINVNGIRAAARKGFLSWLSATTSDVVCLQEVRAEPDQLTDEVREPDGWHAFYAPSVIKGRSGVGILSRTEPDEVRIGFGSEEFDGSGRYMEAEWPGLIVSSLYLPSGEAKTPRQDEKERFMKEFFAHLSDLRQRADEQGSHVLVCGDWNIAHQEIDLKNWRGNRNSAGFLPEEREWMTQVYGAGFVDVVRRHSPEGPGPYSWWSYRGKAFDNDSGWRIDLHVATSGLAAVASDVATERAAAYDQRWSDHAPVSVTYGL